MTGRSLLLAALLCQAVLPGLAAQEPRLEARLVTDEADAVLAILAKRVGGQAPDSSDWQRLFASEGYRRLKQRELSLQRPFEDSSFRSFVLSPALLERRDALAAALGRWATVDLTAAARRALAYLPADARIRVRVYPAIKPRENTFVFEVRTDPAIFFYLDPAITPARFENTLAHEFHHIGLASACPESPRAAGEAARNRQAAVQWLSGFADGRAMLAAAGGADVHPHATSNARERAVWERDVANIMADMDRLAQFSLAIAAGRLGQDEQSRQGMSFVNTDSVPQGPYYTVGYVMARTVEAELGRERLVASTCDPLAFLRDYNEAAARRNRARGTAALPLWPDTLFQALANPVGTGPPAAGGAW